MKNMTPRPNYMILGMLGMGGGKLSPRAITTKVWDGSSGSGTLPGMMVVIWGSPAWVPSWRGQSGGEACPRRLAWQQRAPRPSFAAFCSRSPTWAWGQTPRQGPVLGNNASVFLLVEGRLGG